MRFLFFGLVCRYDLLCLEGIVQSLRIFVGLDPIPVYRVSEPIRKESMLKMHVKPEVRFVIMGKIPLL